MTNVDDIATSLRRTLRTGPAPVWLVTAATPDGRFGMTATAVFSASLAPPTLAVCVNRTASIYGALMAVERFGVQALTSDHMDIALQFGSTRLAAERFLHGEWSNPQGVPCLTDALGSFICVRRAEFDVGTHTIFIGEIVEATDGSGTPLVLHEGQLLASAHNRSGGDQK
ncbi:flavin reductase family protein [Sphingobium lactosutens]|uniref:flavin reductase family protein n=1 Tax=Sphingobium lactosutens TaxID=522773 RepID=UPI0015BD2E59